MALQLCQKSAATPENQWVAGRNSPFTVEDGSWIIPGPHVGTYPSGRGKIAYWPDWVLARCQRIAELLRQGHTLGSAYSVIETDRTLRLIDEAEQSPDVGALVSKKVRLPNGQETNLESVIDAFIARAADNRIVGDALRHKLVMQMRNANVTGWSLKLLAAGYNPVCVFLISLFLTI